MTDACILCGSLSVNPVITAYSSRRRHCSNCGESWIADDGQRQPMIIPDRGPSTTDQAINELVKLQYETENERIHNLGR